MNSISRKNWNENSAGLTLIELTLVLTLILGLISVLFIGANSYKQGVNRANCIQSVSSVQRAMRSHTNLFELSPGDSVPNLKGRIIGPGRLIPTTPLCPGGGVYSYWEGTVPPSNTAFMQCTIGDHAPASTSAW